MAKRGARADTLTGGTRDVNPQFMSLGCTMAVANTTQVFAFGVPIQRINPARPQKAITMEILKVMWQAPALGPIGAAAETAQSVQSYIATSDPGVTAVTTLANPHVVDGFFKEREGAFTAAGTYASTDDSVEVHDLTDGSGHGVLIATDNIYIQVASTALAAVKTVNLKILYRWKEVELVEYIGIVQSQQ